MQSISKGTAPTRCLSRTTGAAGAKRGSVVMRSGFKGLTGCLGALLVLSAIVAGAAQAARPIQPHFTTNGGETLKSNLTIEANIGRSRLWGVELGTVIRCEKGSALGAIEPKGRGIGTASYSECKVFATKENITTKQIEEGEEFTGCKIENIITKPMRYRVVWSKTTIPLALLAMKPASGTEFASISISGSSCLAKGIYVATGSMLSLIPRLNVESVVTGALLSNTINENGKVVQEATAYEVEEGGIKEEVTGLELRLSEKPASLEEVGQLERIRGAGSRGLAGLHE
jgi:hypothetical protein